MDVLIPNTEKFLNPIVLKPLYEYIITIPTVERKLQDADIDNLKCECKVFKNVLNGENQLIGTQFVNMYSIYRFIDL